MRSQQHRPTDFHTLFIMTVCKEAFNIKCTHEIKTARQIVSIGLQIKEDKWATVIDTLL